MRGRYKIESSMSRAKYWVFTLNNYTPEEEQAVAGLVDDEENKVYYLIYGREVGEQGTPHLQGYVELADRARLSVMRHLVPRAHWERRRGSAEQAIEYCRKEGDFVEVGEPGGHVAGERNDLELLHASLRNGRSLREISDDHFKEYLRYERSIRSYILLHAAPTRERPSVVVYWGRTGTGKTRSVWDNLASPEDIWVYGGGGWFDGYIGQKIALFDDFHGGEMQLTLLLKVLDRYPLRVPVKGGFTAWTPQEIYITSNIDPSNWYPNANREHRAALTRRFSNVVYFQ